MLKGLRTAIYTVNDLERAKAWYANVLGEEPYFDTPYYVGFNVGGYELGLMPAEGEADSTGAGNVVTYWGVGDIELAVEQLMEDGAQLREDVQDVGGGIRLATVDDPFGNVLGVIENPHFQAE